MHVAVALHVLSGSGVHFHVRALFLGWYTAVEMGLIKWAICCFPFLDWNKACWESGLGGNFASSFRLLLSGPRFPSPLAVRPGHC